MRRYVVIKSWRDGGPTVSPLWRMWIGHVEDRHVFEAEEEAWKSRDDFARLLEGRGLTVVDLQTEVICEHTFPTTEATVAHAEDGDCDQAFRVATVRVPAESADHAYQQTCRALGLEPDGKGSETVRQVFGSLPSIQAGRTT